MSSHIQSNTPGGRENVQARIRLLTRVAVLAVTGATVFIGIVVAHEHPGASSVHKDTSTGSGTTGAGTTSGGSSTTSGNSGNSGNSGATGNSGSSAPSSSSSTPSVTSGGTSR